MANMLSSSLNTNKRKKGRRGKERRGEGKEGRQGREEWECSEEENRRKGGDALGGVEGGAKGKKKEKGRVGKS